MFPIDHLRQSKYTGENLCLPCTVVNIVIAAVVSAVASIISSVLGICMFTLFLVTIYLHGYLVPGTPTLTKRHLPERVLRWFDKDDTTLVTNEIVEINPERVLLAANAVKPCRNSTDLCLISEFRKTWHERIRILSSHNLNKDHLCAALDIQPESITFVEHEDALVVYTGDAMIGQWSSKAAMVVDIAAATELSQCFPGWGDLVPAQIARVLMSLRIFVEQCPECDGPVHVEQEAVESCCRSYDVVATACQDCDTRLFEREWDDTVADEVHMQPA